MVDFDSVRDGVLAYADAQIIPKLNKTGQFFAGMTLGILAGKSEEILKSAEKNEAIKALGVISGREIDVEALYAAAKQQIKKQKDFPLDLPLVGRITVCEDDLDELYRYITQ